MEKDLPRPTWHRNTCKEAKTQQQQNNRHIQVRRKEGKHKPVTKPTASRKEMKTNRL